MKWTNKGHEFDELGEYINKTKRIYLYGCVPSAQPAIEQTNWAMKQAGALENEIEWVFVDRDIDKQNKSFLGKKVISPEQFYKEFYINNGIVVVMVEGIKGREIYTQLEEYGMKPRFHIYSLFEFYRYSSLFIYYRSNKIYFHLVDMFAHTNCNINCEQCFVQVYKGVHKKIELEDLKKNIDLLFKKTDFVGIIVFGVAEGFCGSEQLHFGINYLLENYGDRMMTIQVVTNGTIIPNDNLIKTLKHDKVRVAVDDYRDNVSLARKNYDKVIEKLETNKIAYSSFKREYWVDTEFGKKRADETTADFCQRWDKCTSYAKGFPYIGYKEKTNKMYTCVFHSINAYLNLIDEENDDSVDLEKEDPIVIFEFLLGYTDKGYLSACSVCRGIFDEDNSNRIPVAVQIES